MCASGQRCDSALENVLCARCSWAWPQAGNDTKPMLSGREREERPSFDYSALNVDGFSLDAQFGRDALCGLVQQRLGIVERQDLRAVNEAQERYG